ncbi:hypothetical protein BJ165DRAFT_1535063 [Panaeolus papilionaceus]|nr:hypothetical protein BJ165DRAFT_1535063 [Panaeolus papilionaceus]
MLLTFEPGEDGEGHILEAEDNQPVPKQHMARKDAKYFTSEELNLIKPYRQGYRDLPGRDYDAQATYLRKYIFPPLLSHWYRNPSTKGRTEAGNIQIWTDRIAEYAAANWKSKVHLYKPPTFRLTMSDYFYNYHYNEVLDEVKVIVELEEGPDVEVTSNDITAYRHRAVRQILERKSPSETAKLEAARKLVLQAGHTAEIRQKQWKRHGVACMKRAHQLQLMELGVCCVQFCVVPQEDGTVMVTAFENLAEGQGFPGAVPFSEQYPEETKVFAEHIVDYVGQLQEKIAAMQLGGHAAPLAADAIATDAAATDVALETKKEKQTKILSLLTTAEGFPILPTTWEFSMNRDLVEMYWKSYLLAHYRLASATPTLSAIPWKAITTNGRFNFVDPLYFPLTEYPDFKFTAYRQMDTEEMITFFQKAAKRQENNGPEMAFRFSHVWSRKTKTLLPAMYPEQPSGVQSPAPPRNEVNPMFENVMAGKRKKRKARGRAGDNEIRSIETGNVEGGRTEEEPVEPESQQAHPPALGVLAAGPESQQPSDNAIEPIAASNTQGVKSTRKKKTKGGQKKKRRASAILEMEEDQEEPTRVLVGEEGNSLQEEPGTQTTTLLHRRSGCFAGAAAKYPTPFSDRAPTPANEGAPRASQRLKQKKSKQNK